MTAVSGVPAEAALALARSQHPEFDTVMNPHQRIEALRLAERDLTAALPALREGIAAVGIEFTGEVVEADGWHTELTVQRDAALAANQHLRDEVARLQRELDDMGTYVDGMQRGAAALREGIAAEVLGPVRALLDDRGRVARNLRLLAEGAAGKHCVVCDHVRHNELAYCQITGCVCASGTSVNATARIILRDLTAALSAPVQAAEHVHEWVDATNQAVTGTDMCLSCPAVRAQAAEEVGGE